jgi:hypothetical protein
MVKLLRIKFLLLLIVFSISSQSCRNAMERQATGKWFAAQLIECDDLIPIQREQVNLALNNDGTYVFNSTLNVHEEGKFRIRNNYLYTLNRLSDNAKEKIVRIARLSNDSLELEMNYRGREQFLTLIKEPSSDKIEAVATPDSTASK